MLLSVLLRVAASLKRTRHLSLNFSAASGELNMAITGVTLLNFMITRLFQLRFGNTQSLVFICLSFGKTFSLAALCRHVNSMN